MTSNKVLPWVKSKIIYKKNTLSKLFTSIELLWFLTQNNIREKVRGCLYKGILFTSGLK